MDNSTVLFLEKAKPILATLALVTRSTTGMLSGLGRIKGRSISGTAQDLVSGTHPKPPILKVNEKLVFEFLSVDEVLDRLALASASRDPWTKESENGDGRIDTPLDVLGSLILIEGEEKHRKNFCSESSWLLTLLRATMVNDDDREETARRMTVDSARELGGSVE